MSLRPRAGAPKGQPACVAEVLSIINEAQAANAAFTAMQKTADTGVNTTLLEKFQSAYSPWKLTFEQTYESAGPYGGVKVMHDIKIEGGVQSRLKGMVEALTKAVAPVYEGDGWGIVLPGAPRRVCSKPDDSYGSWEFAKVFTDEPDGWTIPSGLPNPEQALRVIFGVPLATAAITVVIDDVEYTVAQTLDAPGQLAAFSLTRAGYLRDKVSK